MTGQSREGATAGSSVRVSRSERAITGEPDLADEAAAVVGRHFDHAVGRYRQARPSLSGDEADGADAMLAHAVERLTERLAVLQAQQHARDLDGVAEAARFIDARHPG